EKKFYRQCELGCGPQHREFRNEILQAMQVGDGPQQREVGFPISTDNASWQGPNIEAGGKSAYNNVQVGVNNEINFAKISFLSHSH
ncbi:hypothetical protein, partial [Staphylococcus aureus]|uniref:hypothetical protein n=2 Tax=Staphylococcus aureus TaxID=1280 RepID=UPI001C1F69E0